MDERVIRAMLAQQDTPLVIVGKTKYFHDPAPLEGNHPRLRENVIISNRPNQKAGIAIPIKEITMPTLSNIEFCLSADIVPMGTEKIKANIILAVASCIVAGKRANISPKTE